MSTTLPHELLDATDEFRLAGTELFLDARRPRGLCAVSHAHSDHLGRHQHILATPATASLLRHRLGETASTLEVRYGLPRSPVGTITELGYRQPYSMDDVTLELLPAGHVLGSAMVHLITPRGRLLYTGDFRLLADARTVEPADLPDPGTIDTLVMESTYGLPRYRFPPRQAVITELCEKLRATQRAGRPTVVLTYSLGKSQEVARILTDAGFAVSMHAAPHAISAIYQRHRVDLGAFALHDPRTTGDSVLIAPPHLRRGRLIASLKNPEIFAITGWALDPGCKYRHQAHHALCLSDHADFAELNALVDHLRPRLTLVAHGFVDEFVDHLRARGHNAKPAIPPRQGRLFDT